MCQKYNELNKLDRIVNGVANTVIWGLLVNIAVLGVLFGKHGLLCYRDRYCLVKLETVVSSPYFFLLDAIVLIFLFAWGYRKGFYMGQTKDPE